ncbi:M16 family metallopeptidase [Cesiribacter andamanensis]|uniref:Peptidase M16 inactive domain protein n=1 Tax=Cesiribacter andamanensis AMV16 TaxID=1279009 RepID=M7NJ46_9BACT|nr:pitrilysin family protein [Cesiribacter andamanensis]EMR01770.1 Peptidase M16 inactive domain protein [Cesiribacter andamanensis AMV16]
MKKLTLYTLSLLLCCLAPAYAQKQTPPEGGKPKDFKLPNKEEGSLDNGLGYTLVPYGAVPKAQVSLVVKTGNIHEAENEVWLSDFMGNLMKEGTLTTKGKDLSLRMARMGGDLNINVDPNTTTISGNVLSEFVPELIQLIADVVQNPAFPESEAERLKNDLKRQLSVSSNTPQSQASSRFFALMYPEHSYGRIFPTQEMIEGFTAAKARQFYETNFGARRSVLYVAGKFNKAQAEEAIRASFSGWLQGPEPKYPTPTAQPSQEVAVIDRPNAPQSTLMLGLPVIDPSQPDYLPLQVTNALLGGSFGSRITSNIREDKGYTYSPFSTVNVRKGAAVWYEQADVTTEHTQASLQEITKEVKRLQQEAPTAAELEGIQNYQAGIFVLQNSTPQGIIGQLNFLDLHGLPDSYLTNYVQNVYAITPEKVKEMTAKYLDTQKMTLVVVGDKKEIEKQMKGDQSLKVN